VKRAAGSYRRGFKHKFIPALPARLIYGYIKARLRAGFFLARVMPDSGHNAINKLPARSN